MDWDACIICGKSDGELKCPAEKSSDDANAYCVFLENVQGFRKLGKMPVEVAISSSVTADDLLQKRAKWHKACNLKFASSKLQRAQERCSSNEAADGSRKSRRLSVGKKASEKSKADCCIFCSGTEGSLHNCSTLTLDKSLRDMAIELHDSELLSRLAGGDLVAIEAKYHNNCLRSYKNKHRSMKRKQHTLASDKSDDALDSRLFAELVAYIEAEVEEGVYIFKLSELHQLYEKRLEILDSPKNVNKTRLKMKLLNHFLTDCQEQSDGKNVLLVFNKGMQRLLRETMSSRDFEKEALAMVTVSNAIRKEISDGDFFNFAGSFPTYCEENAVPQSLKSFVSMLLYGPNIKDQTMKNSRACLTICQLILFNFKERVYRAQHTRHDKTREPPLPIYVGLDIHARTRSRKLITELSELGLSINYARVLEIEDLMTCALCQRYLTDDLVCPSQLRNGVFTIGALDNIDHNPSSTTAKGSFHGTSMSVFQFPTPSNPGICKEAITLPVEGGPTHPNLPDSYSIVPAVVCNTSALSVSKRDMREIEPTLENELAKETEWVETSIHVLSKNRLEKGDLVAWSAHHASRQETDTIQAGTSTLLPLFTEKAATISMVKHGMTVISRITEHCNPGQIPVIVVDQPLFALAKYVQWQWPDSLGESAFTVMLGGLHIEIALWRVVGDLLEESGWTETLTEADVASAGTSDSFLSAAHLTKTRRAHQVTALALSVLQKEAHQLLTQNEGIDAFKQWKIGMTSKSPMFKFWDLILRLELTVLTFVRAHRERNFALYVQTMEQLAPLFFALDHTNYARWLPVHIRDMKSLPEKSKEGFLRCWVFPKTHRKFSAIPLDQAHEQNNKLVKDSGGAVGLTENPSALRRWMISGPEQMRLLKEFQSNENKQGDSTDDSHSQGISSQETFKKHVNSMCQVIRMSGNPFLVDDSDELMRIDNHDCVDKTVKESLGTLDEIGKNQYDDYVKTVLVERTRPIQNPIKKNHMPLFKRPPTQQKSKTKLSAEDLKSDYSLFSQLFIASQVRDGDLEEFFSHENHPWPPSLSHHGKLRLPTSKSELLDCLDSTGNQGPEMCDAKVFDGAVVVHSLPRGEASTFGEYSQQVFLPWIQRQLRTCNRIDIVWDTYIQDSLKESTREKRGKGTRRKVARQTRLPINFVQFLHDAKNKEELFSLLSADIAACEYPEGKEVYITTGQSVAVLGSDIEMPISDHEEADTRMCLHVKDAIEKGAINIVVSTVDTDVVVILLGIFSALTDLNTQFKLWVEFGKGRFLRYYNINEIYHRLGVEGARSIPLFHAFTGCDTTSQFGGKGKKSAWKAWKLLPQVTQAFSLPSFQPFAPIDVTSESFRHIERFTCVLYDHTTELNQVNDLLQDLFSQGKHVKLMQNLPPTQASLFQHTLRSLYQASVWLVSLQATQNLPSPERFGWTRVNNLWQPVWTTLPEAAKSCRELIKCGCKATPQCFRKCVCKTSQLKCTSLCACKGNCERI